MQRDLVVLDDSIAGKVLCSQKVVTLACENSGSAAETAVHSSRSYLSYHGLSLALID
jgi:hypothetical protein